MTNRNSSTNIESILFVITLKIAEGVFIHLEGKFKIKTYKLAHSDNKTRLIFITRK